MTRLDEAEKQKPQMTDDEFMDYMHKLVTRAKDDRKIVTTIEDKDTALIKLRTGAEKVEELGILLRDAADHVANWESRRNSWKVLERIFVDKEIDSFEKGYTLVEMARAWQILTGDLRPIRDIEKTVMSMIMTMCRKGTEIRSESVDRINRYFWHRKFKDLKQYHDKRGDRIDSYMVPFLDRERLIAKGEISEEKEQEQKEEEKPLVQAATTGESVVTNEEDHKEEESEE